MPPTCNHNIVAPGAGPRVIDAASRLAFSSLEDITAAEQRPYEDAVPFPTTASLLEAAAETYGDAAALQFLVDAEADAPPLQWSFNDLWSSIRRAANLFRSLGQDHQHQDRRGACAIGRVADQR